MSAGAQRTRFSCSCHTLHTSQRLERIREISYSSIEWISFSDSKVWLERSNESSATDNLCTVIARGTRHFRPALMIIDFEGSQYCSNCSTVFHTTITRMLRRTFIENRGQVFLLSWPVGASEEGCVGSLPSTEEEFSSLSFLSTESMEFEEGILIRKIRLAKRAELDE